MSLLFVQNPDPLDSFFCHFLATKVDIWSYLKKG